MRPETDTACRRPGWLGRCDPREHGHLRSGGRKLILSGHRDRVYSVAFSRFGGLLATASRDHDVRIWNVATGEQVARLQHGTAVQDAQFSPDDRWLITAASKAGLWDVRDRELVLRLRATTGQQRQRSIRRAIIYTGGTTARCDGMSAGYAAASTICSRWRTAEWPRRVVSSATSSASSISAEPDAARSQRHAARGR